MTAREFFAKYIGKYIDYDKALGYQCMDLYHKYVEEVLPGFPHPGQPYAAKLWDNYDPKYYDRINNGPLDVPQEGDILIWTNGNGHVAIYISGNVMNFISFDQNFPTGSPCHNQSHNYFGGLRGWLRPKNKMIAAGLIRSIVDGPGSDGDKLIAIRKLL